MSIIVLRDQTTQPFDMRIPWGKNPVLTQLYTVGLDIPNAFATVAARQYGALKSTLLFVIL